MFARMLVDGGILTAIAGVTLEPEQDYRAYYFSRQKWIVGVIMAIWLIDWCDTLMKPAGRELLHHAPLASAPWILTEALLLPAIFTNKVWYHGLVAALMLLSVLAALLARPALGR